MNSDVDSSSDDTTSNNRRPSSDINGQESLTNNNNTNNNLAHFGINEFQVQSTNMMNVLCLVCARFFCLCWLCYAECCSFVSKNRHFFVCF